MSDLFKSHAVFKLDLIYGNPTFIIYIFISVNFEDFLPILFIVSYVFLFLEN